VANVNGYNILIYQSNESYEHEVKGIETLLAARVDGILVSIAKETVDYTHFTDVAKRGLPIVFFDRGNDNMGIPSVVIDDYKGAFIATERLIKQGYQRVAHISGPQHVKVFYDRFKGYMAALQVNNVPFDPSLVFQGNISIESGKKAADYFLSLPQRPDAVFAVEDFCALGLMKSIKEHGLRIPDEFGIMGFANELFGEHTTPSLSTIDQQTVLMGKEAFKLLLELIEKKDLDIALQKKIVLEPIPIFRESSERKKH
ncbi:MAG TPA: substrate-binding domain-containing protein, partial [Puia sp.]|nr:substrate-binding domain-containing protein [Puia sp.]